MTFTFTRVCDRRGSDHVLNRYVCVCVCVLQMGERSGGCGTAVEQGSLLSPACQQEET